jgi:hypothetical protein
VASPKGRGTLLLQLCLLNSKLTWPVCNSPLTASIHTLDNDSLINVFYLYRPFLLGEDDEDENARLFGGRGRWVRGRWWYNLAHVCQRWRNVILGSASYLGVFLVCTNGTPVANMLEHSPPLPLIIDYRLDKGDDITAEDEEEATFALKQYHDRVRRVRLAVSVTRLQKLVAAMDDEYPVLEFLLIGHREKDSSSTLVFPETLQAPNLRHLTLFGFALPVGCRLLTTAPGLVTLWLHMIHPSAYFHPNTLLQWLSSMPQLEILLFGFTFAIPNSDVERQLTHTPIMTAVALPNLRRLAFRGVGTFLEAILHRITAPHLEKLEIEFYTRLTFSVPRLLQFVGTAENLTFKSASVKIMFDDDTVDMEVYPHEEADKYALAIAVNSCHLDWQVSSVAQIFNSLSPMLSAVDHLTLEHSVHTQSSEEHNEPDPTEWRKFLRPFMNVKTLRIAKGLVKELSRCLELDDGELSLELLPELQELTYSRSHNTGDAFTSFIDARQDAGRSITLVRRSPSPDPTMAFIEPSSVSPASGDGGSDLDT